MKYLLRYDPGAPCNLIAAASLRIQKALVSQEHVHKHVTLLKAVAHQMPYLTPFWGASILSGQTEMLLNMALKDSLPISLAVAFWTGTIQSFIQVRYVVPSQSEGLVSRALEFTTSFFCRPEVIVPWTPSPPFGVTPVENLSLEVRAHYEHDHRPLAWETDGFMDSYQRYELSDLQNGTEVLLVHGSGHESSYTSQACHSESLIKQGKKPSFNH